jgi:hypothetical protein
MAGGGVGDGRIVIGGGGDLSKIHTTMPFAHAMSHVLAHSALIHLSPNSSLRASRETHPRPKQHGAHRGDEFSVKTALSIDGFLPS